jgi:inosose dehydratase
VARLDRERSGLDAEGWEHFAQRLDAVARHCGRRGYLLALRPRVGSYVEAPWEIDAALRAGDVGLCLDTGQVLLGGGDPVAVLREWSRRVELVVLKDALTSRMQDVIDEGDPAATVWSREVFCALGEGDVDCVGILQQLEVVGYQGWLVVEHDAFPSTVDRIVQGFDDQRRNRQFLLGLGL